MNKEKEIIKILEDQGLNQDEISEVMADLKIEDEEPLLPEQKGDLKMAVIDLKSRYDDEGNWRKKAALAARIMSLDIDY